MNTMIPAATNEALSTCTRINQWLDGQRSLDEALRANVATSNASGCSLRGDNVTSTVRPGAVTR